MADLEAQQTCNLRARIIGDGNTYELLLDNQYSEDSDLTEITVRGETDEVDEIKFVRVIQALPHKIAISPHLSYRPLALKFETIHVIYISTYFIPGTAFIP
jgi:hypothetical protein